MTIQNYRFYILLYVGILLFIGTYGVNAQNRPFTVVIDPGHGGKDPGAVGKNTREKDVVLSVGKQLGELISKNHRDVKVVYTRNTDKFVALNQRANIANKANANLFISLHCNALDRRKKSPQGVETFVLGLHRSKDNLDVAKAENAVIMYEDDYSAKYEGFNPNEPESYIIFEYMANEYLGQSVYLASLVQHRLVDGAKRRNRNVRQAGFLVLREVAMPSILVELGYISNPSEEQFLKSSSGQTTLAKAIYRGFAEYKREYDKKSNVFTNPEARKKQASSSNNVATSDDVEYRIQFLSSSRKLTKGAAALKGLWPVDYYKVGNTYRYTYGSTTNKTEINKQLRSVQSKFKDAFIITFKDGKRI